MLTVKEEKIIEAIKNGKQTAKEIAIATGLSLNSVRVGLWLLQRMDIISKAEIIHDEKGRPVYVYKLIKDKVSDKS